MSDYPAFDCAQNILGLMAAGTVGRWARLEVSYGLVVVSSNNPNFTAGECEQRVVTPLREQYPAGHDRWMGGHAQGRTKRDVRDAWRYTVRLSSDEAHAGHGFVGRCSCPELLVYFPRAHREHVWETRLIRSRAADSKTALKHACYQCGRQATTAQAAAAKLPSLVWPS